MGGLQAVLRLSPSVISSHVRDVQYSRKSGVEYNPLLTSHNTLTLTKVNTYGLLYEWKGSDDGLKPLLLTAHQGSPPAHVNYFLSS